MAKACLPPGQGEEGESRSDDFRSTQKTFIGKDAGFQTPFNPRLCKALEMFELEGTTVLWVVGYKKTAGLLPTCSCSPETSQSLLRRTGSVLFFPLTSVA